LYVATPVPEVVALAVTTIPFDFVIVNVTLAPLAGEPPALTVALMVTDWLRLYVARSVRTLSLMEVGIGVGGSVGVRVQLGVGVAVKEGANVEAGVKVGGGVDVGVYWGWDVGVGVAVAAGADDTTT
jgi:hypothetical protein